MNKQEAIKKIDRTLSLPHSIGSFPYDYEDGLRYAKHIINQIDEPEKPVIPQFVAEWIKKCKTFKNFAVSLSFALQPSAWEANRLSDECIEWLTDAENQDLFSRAWLDGYEVEKKERYIVVLVKTGQVLYKISDKNYNFITLNLQKCKEWSELQHTKQELETEGFGWVFDCEGVEVREVE